MDKNKNQSKGKKVNGIGNRTNLGLKSLIKLNNAVKTQVIATRLPHSLMGRDLKKSK